MIDICFSKFVIKLLRGPENITVLSDHTVLSSSRPLTSCTIWWVGVGLSKWNDHMRSAVLRVNGDKDSSHVKEKKIGHGFT